MSDATDINSLPTNPALGSTDSMPNIVFVQNEKINNSVEHIVKSRDEELKTYSQGQVNQVHGNVGNEMPTALDQTLINKLITGIQQASASGLTSLPSSHIPMDTNSISSDPQTRPNYIPQSSSNDYIGNNTSNDDLMKYHNLRQNKQDSLDVMYDELQIPILIGIIYFMFQLPFFRKHLFTFLPSLFNKDGNPKLSGYAFNSLLFAVFFYVVKKLLNFFTDI